MSNEHIVGGAFGRIWGAPIRFFSQFGILGVPFIFVYTLVSVAIASVALIGFIWFCVYALMYLLFGHATP